MQNFKQQLHVPPTHLCSDLKRLKTKSKMLLQNWLQHNRTLVWAMLTNKIHNLFRSTTLQKGRNCQFCPFHVRLGVPVPNEPWLAKSRRSGVMQHKQGYSFCAWSLWTSLVRGLAKVQLPHDWNRCKMDALKTDKLRILPQDKTVLLCMHLFSLSYCCLGLGCDHWGKKSSSHHSP